MKVSHQDLFPTRIWSAMCDHLLPEHEAYRARIAALRVENPTPAGRSNRGGWNSSTTLLQDPVFASLKASLIKLVEHALRQSGNVGSCQITIAAWANMHSKGGYNTLHLHPGHLLSGVYYLSVPPKSGAIIFRDPKIPAIMTGLRSDKPFARNFETVQPQETQMLLFPSWLEHRVEENESDDERISIAFNVKLLGFTPDE